MATSQLSKAMPSTDSTLTVPDSLMKAWFNDPKHGQEFRTVVDRLAEEFKVEEATKVKKRVFKQAGGQPKAKITKTVDMSGFNVKPASEEPQNAVLSEVNMLNLPDCKLVIQANTIHIKNCGENKVVIVQTSICSKNVGLGKEFGSWSYLIILFDWLTDPLDFSSPNLIEQLIIIIWLYNIRIQKHIGGIVHTMGFQLGYPNPFPL